MKALLVIIGSIVLVAASAFLSWALVMPALFDREVSEELPAQLTQPSTATPKNEGTPSQPDQNEPPQLSGVFAAVGNHEVTGSAIASGTTLRLTEQFDVTNGPDLFVYIGTESEHVTEVAPLKGNIGAQNYELPTEVTEDTYVWIYCKAFEEGFAKTRLQSE